ncbi:4-carboxymuconolactone decarboxylase [Roseibacterium elongatum DSM 19469]|uniref:4-carboxymuconolactone decarboxylase n=1 Tax=Roseicyclus elongatus DSM 19469 TaxID=1294273 RepID=W8RXS9_9RHOB|nr:carboxymuconolactone decarboxylase family protein [Roseibacterium elongatum]AHM02632.1 4-carboxymuconolactone decarboxylase [Roseibacterium elongatum DSM 19469]
MTSDAPKNPFEALMRQSQDMAESWVKAVNPALANMTPMGFDKAWPTVPAEMLEMFLGKQFNPEGLDAKTRLLLTLMGLTIQGAQAEAQLRLTVRHAIAAGATKQEVAETIAMAALFGGVPAMNKAMDLAKQALDEEKE